MKVLATILLIVVNLTASGFYELDTKASSMGGAGLTNSAYFNPAVLANKKSIDFSMKMGGDVQTDKDSLDLFKDMQKLAKPSKSGGFKTSSDALIKSIKDPLEDPKTLLKLDQGEKINLGLADSDAKTIKDAKKVIKNISNIKIDTSVGLGINLNVHNYSLAFIDNISINVVPDVQIKKLEIIQGVDILGTKRYMKVDLDNKTMYKTTKEDYDNNSLFEGKKELEEAKVNVHIASLVEIPFMYSYRHNLNYRSSFDGHLDFGLSMKYMMLKKVSLSLSAKEKMEVSDYIKKVLKAKNISSGSLDFGLLYYPNKLKGFKTGLVLKNITSPSFDDTTLKPMVRYGLAYEYSKWKLDTAFDYDITKNKTLSGKDTQIVGGGIGYQPFSWLGASVGVKKDLANSNLGTIMAFGLNLPIIKLSTQFSGQSFYQFQFNLNI